jgi:hypothetical protein
MAWKLKEVISIISSGVNAIKLFSLSQMSGQITMRVYPLLAEPNIRKSG